MTERIRARGSSPREVLDKLGLHPGQAVRVVGQGDRPLLARVRARIRRRLAGKAPPAELILFWPRAAFEITEDLRSLRESILAEGVIWVVTPKKGCRGSNGMPYLNQADLIPLGLAAGLVDNKTCSLSGKESAMRFVLRKRDRSRAPGDRRLG
ncbi:MAG: hypothetical protein ABSF61_09565 [Anaerolineales bacterium]